MRQTNSPATIRTSLEIASKQLTNVHTCPVSFQIKDIYVPDPAQILLELHGNEVLQILLELHGDDVLKGRIIDLSDSGQLRDAFAVVEVEGVSRPLVVPMDRIK
jgi:hypothetical protein